MKFIHFADLHIGKSLAKESLLEDQLHILKQILNIASEREADGLLIAGDVFDSAIPNAESTRVLDEFLRHTNEQDLAVYMIAGNHDSADRLGYGSGFFRTHNIHIETQVEPDIACVTHTKGQDQVDIYLLPYTRRSHLGRLYPEEDRRDINYLMGKYLEATLERVRSRKNLGIPSILIAHQWLVDLEGKSLESDSENPSLGTVEMIPASYFAEFDYLALGHLHSAQTIGHNCVYSGSPLAYSSSEARSDKSVVEVEVRDGKISYQRIPLEPLHRVRILSGYLEDFLLGQYDEYQNDYIYIQLEDQKPGLNVAARLRSKFPLLRQVRFMAFEEAAKKASHQLVSLEEDINIQELFARFFEEESGHPANKRQLEMINLAFKYEEEEDAPSSP